MCSYGYFLNNQLIPNLLAFCSESQLFNFFMISEHVPPLSLSTHFITICLVFILASICNYCSKTPRTSIPFPFLFILSPFFLEFMRFLIYIAHFLYYHHDCHHDQPLFNGLTCQVMSKCFKCIN